MSHQKTLLWTQLAHGIRITPKIMSECFIERD